MSKSYFVLIFILVVIIAGICVFAYSKSLPPAKKEVPAPLILTNEATPAATPTTQTENTLPLSIKTPKDGAEVTSSFISVEGVTSPSADVSVNNKDLLADADGKFKTTLILELGENPLIVFASDEKGNSAIWEAVVTFESSTGAPATNTASPSATSPQGTPSALVAPLPLAKVRGVLQSTASGSLVMKVENNLYTISLNSTTRLVKRYGGKIAPADLKTGDELYVVGRFQSEEKTAISAQVVRNLSDKSRLTHFLTSLSKVVFPRSFLLATTQTVLIPSGAILTNRVGETISFDHFRAGDQIKVWGLFNPDTKSVSGVTFVSNLLLPLISEGETPLASPSATSQP